MEVDDLVRELIEEFGVDDDGTSECSFSTDGKPEVRILRKELDLLGIRGLWYFVSYGDINVYSKAIISKTEEGSELRDGRWITDAEDFLKDPNKQRRIITGRFKDKFYVRSNLVND